LTDLVFPRCAQRHTHRRANAFSSRGQRKASAMRAWRQRHRECSRARGKKRISPLPMPAPANFDLSLPLLPPANLSRQMYFIVVLVNAVIVERAAATTPFQRCTCAFASRNAQEILCARPHVRVEKPAYSEREGSRKTRPFLFPRQTSRLAYCFDPSAFQTSPSSAAAAATAVSWPRRSSCWRASPPRST
jgi:hypothetical protein